MSKVYQLDRRRERRTAKDSYDGFRPSHWPSGFEVGIEVALTWLEQLEHHFVKGVALDGFVESVRQLLRVEAVVAIELYHGETNVLFNKFIEPELLRDLCSAQKFWGRLARIHFSHYLDSSSLEIRTGLSNEHPHVENLLAVPLFSCGTPAGCLAVVNREGTAFGHRDGVLLSLAATILSLACDLEILKNKQEKN